MSTTPRQYHEDHWYHVYARSLDEVCLFENDDERTWFINQLDSVFVRRQLKLGALCLMDTHYHALVKMGSVPLDRALQGLHMSYAKHVNDRRNRDGPVFRPPPGADIVLNDSYLLQLVPYIHNNPVDAGLVDDPNNYSWSTDPIYRSGTWPHDPLTSWQFPPNYQSPDRSTIYQEQLTEDITPPDGEDGYVGGQDEWLDFDKRSEDREDRFNDRRGRRSLESIAETIAKQNETTVDALKQPGRRQPEARLRQKAMVQMYEEGYGPKTIGDFFNRNKGSVVYAVNKSRENN